MQAAILSALLIVMHSDVCRHSIDFSPMNSEFQCSRMNIIYLVTGAGIIGQISKRKSSLSIADIGKLQPPAYLYTPSSQERFLHYQMVFKNQKNNISWYVKFKFWFYWSPATVIPACTAVAAFTQL